MITTDMAQAKDICVRETRFLSSDDGWCGIIRILAQVLSEEDFYRIYKDTAHFSSSFKMLSEALKAINAGVTIYTDPTNGSDVLMIIDADTVLL